MIADCYHRVDGRGPLPCPPMCPVQGWPRYLFRLTAIRGRWVSRRRYRAHVSDRVAEWAARGSTA